MSCSTSFSTAGCSQSASLTSSLRCVPGTYLCVNIPHLGAEWLCVLSLLLPTCLITGASLLQSIDRWISADFQETPDCTSIHSR